MSSILVENKYGHGAIRHTKARHILQRFLRPKLGKSSTPFDWEKGYSSLVKVGNIPIKNQETSDSCGGQAGSYTMAILFALLSGEYIELSAKSIYSLIFYPGGGTTSGSIENVFKRDGALQEAILPSYPATEQNLEDKTWRTPQAIQSALRKAGFKPVTVSLNMEAIAEAVRDYGVVILQLDGTNNGTWLSTNPVPPKSGEELWGHFVCVVEAGMVNGVKTLSILNSWGADVGIDGKQYLTQSYFDAKDIIDALTFITPLPIAPPSLTQDVNNTTLTPNEANYFSQTVAWIGQAIMRLFGR